jgi:hypothetical protein
MVPVDWLKMNSTNGLVRMVGKFLRTSWFRQGFTTWSEDGSQCGTDVEKWNVSGGKKRRHVVDQKRAFVDDKYCGPNLALLHIFLGYQIRQKDKLRERRDWIFQSEYRFCARIS